MSEEFYRGLKRFTKNYSDRIASKLALGFTTAEYDDFKRWFTHLGDFRIHFEEYGEKKILSSTEKNEEE